MRAYKVELEQKVDGEWDGVCSNSYDVFADNAEEAISMTKKHFNKNNKYPQRLFQLMFIVEAEIDPY